MNEPKLFTLIRRVDESGVSGTGRVLDGVIFHTGQVVVCWRSDISPDKPGYSSLAIYPSWEAFLHVHVRPHPPNAMEVRFASQSDPDGSARQQELPAVLAAPGDRSSDICLVVRHGSFATRIAIETRSGPGESDAHPQASQP